jgi:hypothetical protein
MPHLMALLVREAIECVEQVGQEEEHFSCRQLARHVGEAHDVCTAMTLCKCAGNAKHMERQQVELRKQGASLAVTLGPKPGNTL